jgi:hypothetical protein
MNWRNLPEVSNNSTKNLEVEHQVCKVISQKLGETWRDQEQAHFAREFQQTMQKLYQFVQLAEIQIPFLLRKVQRAREYLSFRVLGGKTDKTEFIPPGSQGIFSILDWTGYPSNVPKPLGPFRLLPKADYEIARHEGNVAIRFYHDAHPEYEDKEIHHIHPIKFGGDTVDPSNFLALSSKDHLVLTLWWNRLQHKLEKAGVTG